MSEVSGALAEKDQLILDLKERNRQEVELELEDSLGGYYEKIMRKKGGTK
jgi:hypothetical protein